MPRPQVSLPGHISASVVSTLVLEGWSHQLDPAHSTLHEVRRLLARRRAAQAGWRGYIWSYLSDDRELQQHLPSLQSAITAA
jgi:predicted unusual protein kinase regulating ubiquinone biosynthesis (AarF/ABC1/UbiB family)